MFLVVTPGVQTEFLPRPSDLESLDEGTVTCIFKFHTLVLCSSTFWIKLDYHRWYNLHAYILGMKLIEFSHIYANIIPTT